MIKFLHWNCRGANIVELDKITMLARTEKCDLIFLSETWHTRSIQKLINTNSITNGYILERASTRNKRWSNSRQHGGIALLRHATFDKAFDTVTGEHYIAAIFNSKVYSAIYLPPSLTPSDCLATLKAISKIGSIEMLFGDINCRLGPVALDTITSPVTRAEIIQQTTKQQHLLYQTYTQYASCVIDRVQHTFVGPTTKIVSLLQLETPQDYGGNLLSDHPPFTITFTCIESRHILNDISSHHRNSKQVYLKFLDDEATRVKLQNTLQICLHLLPQVEELELVIQRIATNSPEVFHQSAQQLASHYDDSITDMIWWCSAHILGEYKIPKYSLPMRDKKIEYLDRNSNNSNIVRLFKTSMKRFGIDTMSLSSRNCDVDVAEDVVDYYNEIYSKRKELLEQHVPVDPSPIERQLIVSGWIEKKASFMPSEMINIFITSCIEKLNVNKARGLDGISPKLLKCISKENSIVSSLSILFRLCIATGQTPAKWNAALTCLIPKDRNDAATVDKRRPISVLPILRRVFENVYMKLIDSNDTGIFGPSDHILPKAQAGFRKNMSTAAHLITVHDLMQKGYNQVVFFDLFKAYDLVDIERLILKLHQYKQSVLFINLTRSLYTGGTAKFVVNGELSTPIIKYCGLMQGAIWSPLLFNIYSKDLPDRIPRQVQEYTSPVKLFADDTMVLRKNSTPNEDFRHDILLVESWCKENAMRLNTKKSVIIKGPPSRGNAITDGQGCIIPIAEESKYLGLIFDRRGIKVALNIRSRLERAQTSFKYVKLVGWNWSQYIRLLIYKTFIRSKLEYAAAILYQLYISNPTTESRVAFEDLDSFQNECLRWVLLKSPGYRISSSELGVLQIQPILERFQHLWIRHNEHVVTLTRQASDIRDYWLVAKRIPIQPPTVVINRLMSTDGYAEYNRLVDRWLNGSDWVIKVGGRKKQTKVVRYNNVDPRTFQPVQPPSLVTHLKLVKRQESKLRSKMTTLIADSARVGGGFGVPRFFKIKNTTIRHYAVQWCLNNFGHLWDCPHIENNRNHKFKRSCLAEGHIDLIRVSVNSENLSNEDSIYFALNQRCYIEAFDDSYSAEHYTILDDLLNRQLYVKFGLVLSDLLKILDCKGIADTIMHSIYSVNKHGEDALNELQNTELINFRDNMERRPPSLPQLPPARLEASALPGPSGIG